MTFRNTYQFDGWNSNCLFYQWMHWECWCTRVFVSVLWPISSLTNKEDSYLSLCKMTFVSWRQVWHYFWKVSYLCLNVCKLRPAPESSGHIATYIPILYLKLALSHLWCRQLQVSLLNQSRGALFTYNLHSPIGRKLFLYVNHRREVTSDKISSFSKEKSQIMLLDDYFIICMCFVFKPVSALYSFPKIHTGSVVSGKSSISPNRSVS